VSHSESASHREGVRRSDPVTDQLPEPTLAANVVDEVFSDNGSTLSDVLASYEAASFSRLR